MGLLSNEKILLKLTWSHVIKWLQRLLACANPFQKGLFNKQQHKVTSLYNPLASFEKKIKFAGTFIMKMRQKCIFVGLEMGLGVIIRGIRNGVRGHKVAFLLSLVGIKVLNHP